MGNRGEANMNPNVLLGLLLAFVGIVDVLLARVFADRLKLTGNVRTLLTVTGLVFFACGAVLALGLFRLV
jgi:hypothetical protein